MSDEILFSGLLTSFDGSDNYLEYDGSGQNLHDMRKFSRPFGTWATLNCGPNVETLGYCR